MQQPKKSKLKTKHRYSKKYEELPATVKKTVTKLVSCSPEKILLFGSRARNDAAVNSDYDIAILNVPDESKASRVMLEVEEEPLSLLKIDIVLFSKANQKMQDSIIKEGIVLYERD